MSLTTIHHPTTGMRRAGLAGLLAAACLAAAVAWAAFAFASRTSDGTDAGRVPADNAAAAGATLTPGIVAPAYSARFDDAARLEAAAWRSYAAGEFAVVWQRYADALATLNPEVVAPAYRAGSVTPRGSGLEGLVAGAVGELGQPGVTPSAIDLRNQTPQGLEGLVDGAVGMLGQG
jgi:hypothetical protein